jgi:FtsZ-binding cell division protein ZapB
VYVLI